jgi:hypothetical protein
VRATEFQHLIEITSRLTHAGAVGLVDDEDVGHFEQPGLTTTMVVSAADAISTSI